MLQLCFRFVKINAWKNLPWRFIFHKLASYAIIIPTIIYKEVVANAKTKKDDGMHIIISNNVHADTVRCKRS